MESYGVKAIVAFSSASSGMLTFKVLQKSIKHEEIKNRLKMGKIHSICKQNTLHIHQQLTKCEHCIKFFYIKNLNCFNPTRIWTINEYVQCTYVLCIMYLQCTLYMIKKFNLCIYEQCTCVQLCACKT